ncbi:hypothetical protein Pint_34463 [Pistacia integerrima]|uniref:Uncharacterized protein n=1 Tax=Pistacia integerrima TaxID=434235 RepID=A0ACC0X4I4_9ROSI|nr:hypothetical protein Pint_34463 [Pistacia integerrima]KAJ0077550.1 hypothetical protein Patl1_36198 [Pistacia atlantica]KAJ0077552.1 hypothetical protein Patl1_36192 [Pistacia atlantica]
MGFTVAQSLVLIVAAASVLTVSKADWFDWNHKNGSQKIVVGGKEHWHFGYNYTIWALKTPFYVDDVLVFKYDAPNATTFPHSVYLLPDLISFLECDLSKAKMVANTTQGGGDGFEFVLKDWLHPYYFACGEHNGLHCKDGNMKFVAVPLLRH